MKNRTDRELAVQLKDCPPEIGRFLWVLAFVKMNSQNIGLVKELNQHGFPREVRHESLACS